MIMPKLLVVAFHQEGLTYVERAMVLGMDVRVLDCVDNYHHQLTAWYGDNVLQVQGRRADVKERVMEEKFDAAIIQEDLDFVRAALITQSLREAGVRQIIVVTPDPMKRSMYRRCGAHRVVVAANEEQAWTALEHYLPTYVSA